MHHILTADKQLSEKKKLLRRKSVDEGRDDGASRPCEHVVRNVLKLKREPIISA